VAIGPDASQRASLVSGRRVAGHDRGAPALGERERSVVSERPPAGRDREGAGRRFESIGPDDLVRVGEHDTAGDEVLRQHRMGPLVDVAIPAVLATSSGTRWPSGRGRPRRSACRAARRAATAGRRGRRARAPAGCRVASVEPRGSARAGRHRPGWGQPAEPPPAGSRWLGSRCGWRLAHGAGTTVRAALGRPPRRRAAARAAPSARRRPRAARRRSGREEPDPRSVSSVAAQERVLWHRLPCAPG
jgi:hypothetical protein